VAPARRQALATLMTVAILAAACATAPKSPAETAADVALANAVYAALNADPVYYYRHVDVHVDHGVASLTGYVWGTQAVFRAREIALHVPGIRHVVTSQLELEREGLDRGRPR
jgi:osmotically-inducible protein OsmY